MLSPEEIWIWLSEIFCLTEHYNYIAMNLLGVNIDKLEKIYFEEVAPVCYEFFQPYPVDPDLTKFDETWLVESIKKRLAARKSSFLRRIAGDLYIKYLKKACASDWQAFKKAYYSELSRKA